MNFELKEDQKLIREMIKDFSNAEIKPVAKSLEDEQEFPSRLLKKLAEIGVLGMSVPAQYNGNKTDHLSLIIAIEEISRIMPSLAVIISVHCSLFCHCILEFGNETQKEKYMPKAASGEIIGAFSLTEPGAGSDAINLKCKAVRKGDQYIINGSKAWVTAGNNAEAIILFAGTEIEPGRKKLSAFIIDKDTPGLQVTKIEEKMGLHSSLTAEIQLEDCQVPAGNLLGKEGQGASIAFRGLDFSRIGIAAQSVGIAQRAMDEALTYSIQREAFGKKISDFQAIQFKLADIATLTEAARLMTYRAADLFDKGRPFAKESAMAKLFASEVANRAAYEACRSMEATDIQRNFP